MPEREAAALLGTSHFRVLIGRDELGFAEVSPLSAEVDLESGEQFAHVVLRRALSRDTTLFDWRRAIVDGRNDRRRVTVHQFERAGGRIANSWRLVRARPVRWSRADFGCGKPRISLTARLPSRRCWTPRQFPRCRQGGDHVAAL